MQTKLELNTLEIQSISSRESQQKETHPQFVTYCTVHLSKLLRMGDVSIGIERFMSRLALLCPKIAP